MILFSYRASKPLLMRFTPGCSVLHILRLCWNCHPIRHSWMHCPFLLLASCCRSLVSRGAMGSFTELRKNLALRNRRGRPFICLGVPSVVTLAPPPSSCRFLRGNDCGSSRAHHPIGMASSVLVVGEHDKINPSEPEPQTIIITARTSAGA